MSLEEVINTYGKNDYMDHTSGYIYGISKMEDNGDHYQCRVYDK